MKIICFRIAVLLLLMLALLLNYFGSFNGNEETAGSNDGSRDKVVNVFIFGSYLPPDIVARFTRETGIQVNITECGSNEALFAKLRVGSQAGYDLIAPSSYYVGKMVSFDMLRVLDFSKIPNSRYVLPFLQSDGMNREKAYNVPYCWGTTGIVVNNRYIPKGQVKAWKDLWDPCYRNSLMLLDDMRESFSFALLSLGYSVNDENPEHIKQAYLRLKELLPNVRTFNSEGVSSLYLDGDAIIGNVWSGDIVIPQRLDEMIEYVYPVEGAVLWYDSFAILKNAPNADNAYRLIDFMMRPDISLEVSRRLGFNSANREAYEQMLRENAASSAANPTEQQLASCQVQYEIGDRTRELYERYWEMLRLSGR